MREYERPQRLNRAEFQRLRDAAGVKAVGSTEPRLALLLDGAAHA
jgi:hypothetical protein